MAADPLRLSAFAAAGFAAPSIARERFRPVADAAPGSPDGLLGLFRTAADPDGALAWMLELLERAPETLTRILADADAAERVIRLVGASAGLGDFLLREADSRLRPVEPDCGGGPEPSTLARLLAADDLPGADDLPDSPTLRTRLLTAVRSDDDGVAALAGDEGRCALRVAYRRELVRIALADLEQADPVAGLDGIARALADLAGAALEASLSVARADVTGTGPGCFPADEVAATRLAVVGMGKAGAEELNYVSDVDVIFVCASGRGPEAAEDDDGDGPAADQAGGIRPETDARCIDVATRLAQATMRGIDEFALEPALWQVDAGLRPEGKDGALVRSLASHLAYYRRWAKNWEFQALLKARPLAGDIDLGREFVEAVEPLVWQSAEREGFVAQVQAMRERVTENIPEEERDVQLKLGPGGLRDIEFTVQLLQLVHGRTDPHVRQRGTVDALDALAERGYIGRPEAAEFITDYRILRLLEHRVQMREMTRTHLMPRDEQDLRILARSTGLAVGAGELRRRWGAITRQVRGLHERLFYRPLLAAVASTPGEQFNLTSDQAADRLSAIGFLDPRGALGHIAALTTGVSRSAAIQRHLLPVLLQWFAEGADPDGGLLAFRRLSESLGSTHWFLRMLRDSSGAAKRLTVVLTGSHFVTELLGRIPVAVAWLDHDADLKPRQREVLEHEARAVLHRHTDSESAAPALRTLRRREILRLALGAILGVLSAGELAVGLTDIAEVSISAALAAARREVPDSEDVAMAVVAMGRFGGVELGFGSDADLLYVYRTFAGDSEHGATVAAAIVAALGRVCSDPVLPFDLDAGLRPEGRNGPLARSIEAYRTYYRRWSLTWEAQALLRARPFAGDEALQEEFAALADEVRYPDAIDENSLREVKRVKARVEGERLPRGADPRRHLKLGRGSLSDVEWLVQVQQLQHARNIPALRTTSTLTALAACGDAGLIGAEDVQVLHEAWVLASRARSALTLWSNATTDVLPVDRAQLEPVARLLEYGPGAATLFEEDYLAVTRRSRAVFERLFYGRREARPEYG